jgi:hypothetical protein
MIKKKNIFIKLYLKHTDRVKYKEYKWNIANYKNINFSNELRDSGRLNNIGKIKALIEKTHHLNLIHSGHAGDIIYALATIKRLKELTGAKINLYFRLGVPANLPNYSSHPVGGQMLNKKMADMLIPLVRGQKYVSSCEVYNGQEVHIDLDYFRAGVIPQNKGNIARWSGYITGVNPQLYLNWLEVNPNNAFAETILISRSLRYQNTSISHKFLLKYDNVKFVGVAEEYEDIKKILPDIEWVQVNTFLELAQMIKGCKFFIGNQSFPFSLAEAMKVPRILEIPFDVINVVPEGENAYDFIFQEHFESLVELLSS